MTYRNRSYSQAWGRPTREDKAGNIYYVRLKSPFGPLYKLGFTSMSSVHERLAFQGAGHEKLVDVVLGFAYSRNALSIEQTLHGYFDSKRAFSIPDALMPLAGNGQQEVYVDDILGMDEDFTREQAHSVRVRIQSQRTGQPLHAIEADFERDARLEADVEDVMNLRFVWPISWIWRAWCAIEKALFTDGGKRKYEEKVQGMIRWYREMGGEAQRERERPLGYPYVDEVRADRQAKIALRMRQLEQARARVRLAPFGDRLKAMFEALRDRNALLFECSVDVDRLVYNLAEAMTQDLTFGSDYMGVANNCDLMDLMDAIAAGDPRDVLMIPVQEGYKALLRHWVKTGDLFSEDLPIPADPLFYRTSDGQTHTVSPISSCCFGPSFFLEVLGREWHWPQQPGRMGDDVDQWAEFDVEVRNAMSGFLGRLVVRVEPIAESEQLGVSFPNFYAEYRRAIDESAAPTGGDGPFAPPQLVLPSFEERALLREITGFGKPRDRGLAGER